MKLGEEMAKIQAIDMIHKETGVEESDIIIAFQKHDLADSDEFKLIMERCQGTLNGKLQQAMQAIQARMQQQQPRGGMPGQPMAGGGRRVFQGAGGQPAAPHPEGADP